MKRARGPGTEAIVAVDMPHMPYRTYGKCVVKAWVWEAICCLSAYASAHISHLLKERYSDMIPTASTDVWFTLKCMKRISYM